MTDIAQYLMDNYYAKYKGKRDDIIPTEEQLECGIKAAPEKFVIIKDKEIKGVAIYLTLTDESYKKLEKVDITKMEVLLSLIPERGKNLHFILLAADSMRTILKGLRQTLKKMKP